MTTIAQQKGFVRVIVLFDSPVSPSNIQPDASTIANIKTQVSAARDAILSSHFGAAQPAAGQGFARNLTSFPITAGFAVNVTAQELQTLAADPRILTIQHDALEKPLLNESVPLIGAPAAHASGAVGTGQTVAVLDTGVKSNHEFLSGKVVAEACFSNGGGSGVSLCPNGSTSQTGAGAADANTAACNTAAGPTAFNLCYHGTHVAATAAGFNTALSGSEPPNGVAKYSKIMGVQVFTRFNNDADCGGAGSAPCVRAFNSDIISALNYVYANLAPSGYPVASVNMSLGGGLYSSTCDSDARKPIIDSLRAAGVLTAIASGNDGSTSQISAPGCISTAITVGSSSKTDVISSFSNMSSVVDVMGPGGEPSASCTFTGSGYIVAPVVLNNGSTTTYGCLVGTSMATPHVAGAIAALKSAYPAATAAQIESALKNTGVPIADTRAGGTITKPRIRLNNEVDQGWWTYAIAGAGDFNHDGKSDILWRHANGSLVIWLMNGGTRLSSVNVGGVATSWSIVGLGDFNGDGTTDILWRHAQGSAAIWLMNGASPGSILSSGSIGSVANVWTVAGVGKFFGAGSKADILWRNVNGSVAIWRMSGLLVQSKISVGVASPQWSVFGVGDFNGDGTSDVLWRHMNGPLAMWLMSNGGISSNSSAGSVATTWRVAGVHDFSGDGKADIVWRNTNGSVATWLMNGATRISSATVGTTQNAWNIIDTGSFNGASGGLLWRNNNGGAALWFINNAGGFAGSASLGVVP